MKILYISIGLLGKKAGKFKRQAITPVIEEFIGKLLLFILKNNNTRQYRFRDESAGTAARIRELAGTVLGSENGGSEEEADRLVSEIGASLMEAEAISGKKIASTKREVRNGSLIAALVRDEEQGLCAVLAKVDHSRWFDGDDLTPRIGFSDNEKDIWKTALVHLSEEDGLALGDVSVCVDYETVFWTDGFLALTKERSDEDNTKIAFEKMQKLLARRLSGMELTVLWNALTQKMKVTKEMNYSDFVDELIGDEDTVEPDMKSLREEMLALPAKAGFDTRFSVVNSAIPAAKKKKVMPINNYMKLTMTSDDYDPAEYIEAREDDDGKRYLVIKCTDEKTFRNFKRKE